LDDSTRLPPVLKGSLVGEEDGSLEQAAAGPAELLKPVSADRKRIVPPENHDGRPDHCERAARVGPLPATGRVGGWVVHDKAPNTFFFCGSYIYIYSQNVKLKNKKCQEQVFLLEIFNSHNSTKC